MWFNIVGLLVTFVCSMIAAPLAVKAQAPTPRPWVGNSTRLRAAESVH